MSETTTDRRFKRLSGAIPALVSLGMAASLLTLGTPAAGFVEEGTGCNNNTSFTYHFDHTGTRAFTADEMAWVSTTIPRLSQALDRDGMPHISVTQAADVNDQNDPAVGYQLILEDLGQTGSLAVHNCSLSRIRFNSWQHPQTGELRIPNEDGFWAWLGRHEVGHAVGMSHSGDEDSDDGLLSEMATCQNRTWLINNFMGQESTLSQDVSANLARLYDDWGFEQFNANLGLEQDKDFWKAWNGSMFIYTDNPHLGQKYVRFRGEAYAWNSYMHQTVRVWDGSQVAWTRARLQYREQLSTATTTVGVRVFARPLEDGPVANCSSSGYESNLLDPNGFTTTTQGFVKINDTGLSVVNPPAAWTLEQDVLTPGEWKQAHAQIPGPLGDGLEIQLRAHGRSIRPDGVKIGVHFDNIRLEGKYS